MLVSYRKPFSLELFFSFYFSALEKPMFKLNINSMLSKSRFTVAHTNSYILRPSLTSHNVNTFLSCAVSVCLKALFCFLNTVFYEYEQNLLHINGLHPFLSLNLECDSLHGIGFLVYQIQLSSTTL